MKLSVDRLNSKTGKREKPRQPRRGLRLHGGGSRDRTGDLLNAIYYIRVLPTTGQSKKG